MKTAYKHLTFWVLLAVVTGVILGWLVPEQAVKLEPLAKVFVEILKIFVGPLIFVTVTLGIASMGDLKRVGQIGAKALIYFEVVTTFALLIGIVVAYIIRAGDGVLPPAADDVAQLQAKVQEYQTRAEDFSWLHFLQGNLPLQVLLGSVVAGVIITLLP
ncbi:MAG: cation:dicarboxylase symporter family transporter, partial [Pirellulaceae bacterium]|nr:cation:dicarboxylase symporter family transporter [Pirellulaceae bacterium]